ncbi:MAG: glycosyl transferase family 1 [Candidatus Poribacteria bacterium]|nr:MAG: glycosyl transferase family 1 [Candidatus Poribacteria bacterium]
MTMHILAISHPAVAPAYRRKFELIARIAREEGIVLRVIVPEAWPEENRRVFARCEPLPEWVSPLPIVWEGYYARYFYRGSEWGRIWRSFRPDLVHLEEEPYSLCAGQTWWAIRRWVPEARFLFRTSISRPIRLRWFGRAPARWVQARVFRRADGAFVLSKSAGELLRAQGFRGPTHVLPNGVDTRIFRPLEPERTAALREKLGVPEGVFLLGYVGRLIREKGVDFLLQAAAQASGVWLLVVGDGPLRKELGELAERSKIADRVRFLGAQPPEQVAELMNAMDALVLPSRSTPTWVEFFGRVLAEAMACGTPVIGSSCGEIPTTVGDAGLIFPEGDLDALLDCIHRLRGDPHLYALLRLRGLQRVRELYAWEAIARRTVIVYRELLAKTDRSKALPS